MSELRIDYSAGALEEESAPGDPIPLFLDWWNTALAAGLKEPNAMALATCARDGRPSCRMMLLKGFDERGFLFYTNYESRKGRELQENPHAALTLYWDLLERQVRAVGRVEQVDPDLSERYFHSRPWGSRLGAAASRQSAVLTGRDELERAVAELQARYPDGQVPRPPNWGGYRVVPEEIEFWQGRRSRLHDRLLYRREPGGGWARVRLSP
jgi:pyridoxamine 5'-phosphate oxidase